MTLATPLPSDRPLRILVAEDNAVNQILVCKLLERKNHQAVVAADGQTAVELIEQQPFDLILMDMQMPRLSGTDATRQVREMEKRLGRPRQPIIALTANALEQDRHICLEAGMDDYLSKPIQADRLYACIAQWSASAHPKTSL